jgi:hypothetical protein
MEVSAWANPALALAYGAIGIGTLHPWQSECLSTPDVVAVGSASTARNLLFSAPTSGGKSLVAELIAFSRVVGSSDDAACAIFILPYVALVEEKASALTKLLRLAPSINLKVAAFHGKKNAHDLGKARIIVCTPEKAGAILDGMALSGTLSRVRCVVVDEIHLIGEPGRGGLLEVLLSKLLARGDNCPQIVGMSATVPNLRELATWLHASCYESSARPVHLTEYVCIDGCVRRIRSSAAPAARNLASGPQASYDAASRLPSSGSAAAIPSVAPTVQHVPGASEVTFGDISAYPSVSALAAGSPAARARLDSRVALVAPLAAEAAALGGQCLVFAPDRRSVQEISHVLRRFLATNVARLTTFLQQRESDGAQRWEPGMLASAAATTSAAVMHTDNAKSAAIKGAASATVSAAGAAAAPPPDKIRRLRLQAADQLHLLLDATGKSAAYDQDGKKQQTPLRAASIGLHAAVKEMAALVREGVGYHHAGLPQRV